MDPDLEQKTAERDRLLAHCDFLQRENREASKAYRKYKRESDLLVVTLTKDLLEETHGRLDQLMNDIERAQQELEAEENEDDYEEDFLSPFYVDTSATPSPRLAFGFCIIAVGAVIGSIAVCLIIGM